MTGAEHYAEAERLLSGASYTRSGRPCDQNGMLLTNDDIRRVLATAQVHATLALAAATVGPLAGRAAGNTDGSMEWHEIRCDTAGCTGMPGHDGECGVTW